MSSIAIFDAHWSTRGGGERHALMIAQSAIAHGHDVTLLSQYPISVTKLEAHLGLNLSGVTYELLGPLDEHVVEASTRFDVFVNATYRSKLQPAAKKNVYVCFFPTPEMMNLSPWKVWLHSRALKYLEQHPTLSLGNGWHAPEKHLHQTWQWSTGDGEILIHSNAEQPVVLSLELGRIGQVEPYALTLNDSHGTVVYEGIHGPQRERITLSVGPQTHRIHVRTESFRVGGDQRNLGVSLFDMRTVPSSAIVRSVSKHVSWLMPEPSTWLHAYDLILANSQFTQEWISRLWSRDSAILYPPVDVTSSTHEHQKEKIILSVGRFMAPGTGHCKHQLEMVKTFAQMHQRGLVQGWKLVIIGGLEPSHQDYFDDVLSASYRYPIEVIPNAPRSVVDDHLSKASIFWSATGFGDSEHTEPWNQEHFGITTVEAMATGCVPVVIDKAGQKEIINPGVDGALWEQRSDWIAKTVSLIQNPEQLKRIAASAIVTAQQYSDEAFTRRWDELCRMHALL